MPSTPELDQVAEQRSKLAEHALPPWWYWLMYVPVAVIVIGWPVLATLMSPNVATFAVLYPALAIMIVTGWFVRRHTGVHLPRRMWSFPSVWKVWLPTIVVGVAGDLAIIRLADHGQRGLAWALVPVVALIMIAGTVAIRFVMRADIRAGRVRV